MNDQPPSVQQTPRPQSSGARRPRPRPPAARSAESRFVGYLVLGFGVLAVLAVLILAFGGSEEQGVRVADAPKPPDARSIAADIPQAIVMPVPPPQPPPPTTDLFFERDAGFQAAKMEGDWQAAIGSHTAILQIRKNGVFQLVLASRDPAAPRYYSSGIYQVFEDIIMLNPRLEWDPPAVPKGRKITYSKLTRSSFPMIARFDGDKMLWQNPPQAERRVNGPLTSPIFMMEDVRVAVWKKL